MKLELFFAYLQANLEQAENLIKRHEAFLTTMEANDDKINAVVQFASRLCDEGHFDSERIHRKAENIHERRNANRDRAVLTMETLKDQLQLHQFLQVLEIHWFGPFRLRAVSHFMAHASFCLYKQLRPLLSNQN